MGEGFLSGGIWMWLILACQVFSLAIIAERIVTLYVRRRPNQLKKIQPLEKTIKSGNLDHLINQSQEIKTTDPIGQGALVGAQSALNFGGKEEIQLKMDEVLVETSHRLDKNTAFLGTIANVSYVAIPYNAKNAAGALVLANFLLSPEYQISITDPEVLGWKMAIDPTRLTTEEQTQLAAIEQGIATLPADVLSAAALPESSVAWVEAMQTGWEENVLKK
jgi:hypothetical protein